jgi:hypothetical protein
VLLLPPSRAVLRGWVQAKLANAVQHGTVRVASWGFSTARRAPEPGGRNAPQSDGSPRPEAGSPVGPGGSGGAEEEERSSRPLRPGEIIQE